MEVTVFVTDPRYALLVAHERARRLREEAANEHLLPSRAHPALAACLRRVADRLDPTPLAPPPQLRGAR